MKAISALVCDLAEEVTRLKAEKDNLNMALGEVLNTQLSTGSSKAGSSVDKIMKAIPRTYLEMEMTVKMMVPAWISIVSKALTLFIEVRALSWTNRSEVILYLGYLDFTEGDVIKIFANVR